MNIFYFYKPLPKSKMAPFHFKTAGTNFTKWNKSETILHSSKKTKNTKQKTQNKQINKKPSKVIPIFFKKADQINSNDCENMMLPLIMFILRMWWNETPSTQRVKLQPKPVHKEDKIYPGRIQRASYR